MAKKPKPEEHENLERWLVSYGDFITLLFALFVVLYGLAQTDVAEFEKLAEAMKSAFGSSAVMEGQPSVLDSMSNSLMDTSSASSVVAPLMLEYMSVKYEQESYEKIQEEINEKVKSGELSGVEAKIVDKGLLITFKDDLLFYSASADLTPKAKKTLASVGAIILSKFVLHQIRVEGHTDSQPIVSLKYPSNWELSSARSSSIVRYLIERLKFVPSLFTVVGYADTRPLVTNNTVEGRAKNRRVEIMILKNKYKNVEDPQNVILKMSKKEQEALQEQRIKTIKEVKNLSEAAIELTGNNEQLQRDTIKLDASNSSSISVSQDLKFNVTEENKYLFEKSGELSSNKWLKDKNNTNATTIEEAE